MSTFLVTGVAGFIGYHVASRLLERGERVTGCDNLNDYYAVSLKEARLARLTEHAGFRFVRADLADRDATATLFAGERFDAVIHLAAQAGVRYSLVNPAAYIDSNLTGFANLLEGCRRQETPHLVYASSSSVYGANSTVPFSEHHTVDHPLSLYAATKKANELMAHSYAALYGLPATGLRFFTAYGPWGRPDMAYFSFTRAILAGTPIDLYNQGRMQRDFTYIDDIVEGILRVAGQPPAPDPGWRSDHPDPARSFAPWRVYNIGNNRPVELLTLVQTLEAHLGRSAVVNFLPMQPGEVPVTCADIDGLTRDTGFAPATPLDEGIGRFVAWYRAYYGL
ncbi:NAD-dependent epimerase [Trichlorobacter ammonificans]|uniref:Uncharacterized 37.6 kDa protein in cld 5'region n=1 Tax=Trichlorobacter ammonificans TaxID=2916410 RepID=A0ABN8HGD1_9BACT|nr:NAD-dependent epimerase [Trichlorobacter ammonificans]CAH2030490.1 Uncharacterized 37.6 kDa protein in cld 5'region [Trichlorobacter ammonificans]